MACRIIALPTLGAAGDSFFVDVTVSAMAAPDVPPGVQDSGTKPRLHLSALLTQSWEAAEIIIPEKDSMTMLPLLLGLGIVPERLFLYGSQGIFPVEKGIAVHSSEGRIAQYKDLHCGRRAFIVGNGPSLKISDLDRLNQEITFASNKIYLAYDQTKWRPTYYTVCDYLVAFNNAEAINSQDSLKLFPSTLKQYGCAGDGVVWYDERFENSFFKEWEEKLRSNGDFFFSRDACYGVQGGYTVIYHQLQLAYFMGIREVILVGVDFHFNLPQDMAIEPKFESESYRKALVSNGEINHFHPEYRKPGETWSVPRLDLQAHAFQAARKIFENSGGRLINASRQSALTVLPKGNLDHILGKSL